MMDYRNKGDKQSNKGERVKKYKVVRLDVKFEKNVNDITEETAGWGNVNTTAIQETLVRETQ